MEDKKLPVDPWTCVHEWVNVSFSGIKYACKHCNIDKDREHEYKITGTTTTSSDGIYMHGIDGNGADFFLS
jgi:hypothetical protein